MTRRVDRARRAFAAGAGLWAAAPLVGAQSPRDETWPTRFVRFIVPYAAGNQADLVARALADELSNKFGQAFVVENAPGAGGSLGVGQIVRAKPDGYTIGIAAIAALAVVPQIQKVQYDPFADLTMVCAVSELRVMALAAGPTVAARNLQELSALIKSRPDKPLTFSSSGTGTIPHLDMEMVSAAMGGNFLHIPYKGAGGSVTDVIGGQVDLILDGLSVLKAHVDAGRLKILASNVADPTSPAGTFAQQGVSVNLRTAWQSIVAPRDMPPVVVDRISAAVAEILTKPGLRSRYPVGTEPLSLNGPATLARVKEDHQTLGALVKQLGLGQR